MFSDQFPTRNHKEYNGISISYQGIDVNNKQTIINLFRENIKGRKADLTGYTGRHDGKEGHWLERQMGIDPNNDNEADILGFEMKKDTARITTFGDWSPDKALWKNDTPNPDIPKLDRDTEFLEFFGKPNPLKNNRCSWSGEPAPVIARYNRFGQTLRVDDNDNILALYSFSKDQREAIQRAFKEYHDKTCIKFVKRDSSEHDYFIDIMSNERDNVDRDKKNCIKRRGCWSSVGWSKKDCKNKDTKHVGQKLNLDNGCVNKKDSPGM